jgi:propane monooxygenase reductase subunit
MSKIKFSSQNIKIEIEADEDESILETLLRSGTPVPFYCRAGLCGQCKSRLITGSVVPLGLPSQLLTADEQQAGYILICQSKALGDCEVEPVNTFENIEINQWEEKNILDQYELLHDDFIRLRIRGINDKKNYQFLAGQYTRIENHRLHLLNQSPIFIASRPGLPYIDIFMHIDVTDKSELAILKAGSEIILKEPIGNSCIKDQEETPLILVAEKIGVASIIGMVDKLKTLSNAPTCYVFIKKNTDEILENLLNLKIQTLKIELFFFENDENIIDAIQACFVRHDLKRVRAYVKAGQILTKYVRQVLFNNKVRPWEIHVDNLNE